MGVSDEDVRAALERAKRRLAGPAPIGAALRELRELRAAEAQASNLNARAWSLSQVAQRAQIARLNLRRIEQGLSQPKVITLQRIAAVLGYSIAEVESYAVTVQEEIQGVADAIRKSRKSQERSTGTGRSSKRGAGSSAQRRKGGADR